MTSLNRREFLAGLAAAGAAAVPIPDSAETLQSPANVPVKSGKARLLASDFRYLGMFSVGDNPPAGDYAYALGTMTGRRAGGQVRLFVTGDHSRDDVATSDPIFEITPPATISTDHTKPTKAALVRAWGDICSTVRVNGALRNLGNHTEGLLWDASINGLWFAYGYYYNASSVWWDPSIGVCILNDRDGTFRTYGPWRTQVHSQMSRGYMVKIPRDFADAYCGGYTLGVGATYASGAAKSPWGPVMFPAGGFDPFSREPDQPQAVSADVINSPRKAHPRYSILTRTAILHDISHPKSRVANYKKCDWNVKYDCSKGYTLANGQTTWDMKDHANGAVWIDTGTKHGLVFFGGMTWPGRAVPVPHLWYGLANAPCCHGQYPRYQLGTGPCSGNQRPLWWIYDPADIARALQGKVNPWDLPSEQIEAYSALHGSDPWFDNNGNYGFGTWYDEVDKKLYVSELGMGRSNKVSEGISGDVYTDFYTPRPMIHVFQVL